MNIRSALKNFKEINAMKQTIRNVARGWSMVQFIYSHVSPQYQRIIHTKLDLIQLHMKINTKLTRQETTLEQHETNLIAHTKRHATSPYVNLPNGIGLITLILLQGKKPSVENFRSTKNSRADVLSLNWWIQFKSQGGCAAQFQKSLKTKENQ